MKNKDKEIEYLKFVSQVINEDITQSLVINWQHSLRDAILLVDSKDVYSIENKNPHTVIKVENNTLTYNDKIFSLSREEIAKNRELSYYLFRAHEGIKELNITLENLEGYRIPRKHISHLAVDLKERFGSIGINHISRRLIAENFHLVINNSINDEHGILDLHMMFEEDELKPNSDFIYHRVDITSVEVFYDDDLSENNFTFYPIYSNDNFENNSYQKNLMNRFNDISIFVSKEEYKEDFVEDFIEFNAWTPVVTER